MLLLRLFCNALLFLALTAPSVRADDICLGDDEEKAAKAQVAALNKVEKTGSPAELFVAYQSLASNDCIDRYDKNAQSRAKANLPKLGRDLAKAAEAKGLLYSSEPVRADGRTSAFRYFEAMGEYTEANRVMLKAAQVKSDDLALFKAAWGVDNGRYGPRDPKSGEQQPYGSPPAYRQELEKIASVNADRFMKAEEKNAQGPVRWSSGGRESGHGLACEFEEGRGLDEVFAERRQASQGQGRAARRHGYGAA